MISSKLQSNKWLEENGPFPFRSRLGFVNAVRSGKQTFLINNASMTIQELLKYMVITPQEQWGFNPYSSGHEGAVYKFGTTNREVIVKTANKADGFFAEWLSRAAVETGACIYFPLFIEKIDFDDNHVLYAMEYTEYNALYPEYLFTYLLNPEELEKMTAVDELKRNPFYDANAKLTIRMLFLQVFYALYVVQTINGHDFYHNDLHGRNVLVRRVDPTEHRSFLYFSREQNQMIKATIPNIGVEAVIGDFGHGTYPGYFPSVLPFPQRKFSDVQNMINHWIKTFNRLKWKDVINDLKMILRDNENGIQFDLLMESAFVKNLNLVFERMPHRVIRNLYIPSPSTSRFKNAKSDNQRLFDQTLKGMIYNMKEDVQYLNFLKIEDVTNAAFENNPIWKNNAQHLLNAVQRFVAQEKLIELYDNTFLKDYLKQKSNVPVKDTDELEGIILKDLKDSTIEDVKMLFVNLQDPLKSFFTFLLKNAW